jgi:hypothetical protein
MMFGMSYKNSETKPQDKSFGQINFTWYFRKSDGMAFIRETDSSGQNNRNIPGYTALPTDNTKVYSIVKVGVVAQYHIDGVLVHTSLLEAVDNMYYDVAFSTIGGSLTDMKIVYDSGVKTTEIKYEYIDGAPVIPAEIPEITDEQISSGTQTTLVAFTPQKAKTMIETHANTGETQFADLEGVPSILEPRTRTNTFSTPINQWASGVSASSVRNATGGYSPSMAIGAPDTGLAVGADCAGNLKAYAEAQADRDKINTLTLTYTTPVYLSTVTIRETQGSGYVSKLDVKRDGVFVNVFERNIQTKANISGGTMTGSNERKVSDALITLTNQLTYKVSEIRIHLGGFISGVSLLNEIDAVKMTGSETLTQSAYEVDISYLNLKDKPAPTPTPAPETWYGLGEKPPAFKITNATPTLNQWATGATASSQQATGGGFSASRAIGQPDTGLGVGTNGADNSNAWAQADADKTKVNNITLTYASSVHIRSVTVRETFNAGTISKLEVDKNGTFVTVYTRNLTTDAETGGYITGDDNRGRVSDTLITLNDTLNWRSNKIRISLGNAVDQYNEIDAVKLTSPPEAQNTQIDYNYVINKPTSSTVHSVESSSGAHLSMDLEGNTPVEITALRTKITPKFSHSSLSISANIMACAQIGHIFSISIYINGAPYSPSTPSSPVI